MIPSVLSEQLRRGIEDFLRASFPISNPFFHGLLDRLLEEPGAISKGPFVSIELPFIQGDAETNFFSEIPLSFRPYAHQVKAFERIAEPSAESTLVATGTGSGKTECFLYPILDHCLAHSEEKGIKAILIYPMNALATDQAQRIAQVIATTPALKNKVTAGMYVGEFDAKPSKEMTASSAITSKETMRLKPPDILLTNYKMLDYLLIRPSDFGLWSLNQPDTLRYLVVDELHTFDGAQGTDLACLIRRLKDRLKIPEGHLCCVGTSATMGSGEDREGLLDFASQVFDERFEGDAVVTEQRQTTPEFLADAELADEELPPPERAEPLDADTYDSYEDYLRAQHELWLGQALPDNAFGENGWRLALADRLKGHYFFHNLLRALDGKPAELDHLLERLTRTIEGGDDAYRNDLLLSFLALVSEARKVSDDGSTVRPFLNVRLQLWLRELRRMVCKVDREPSLRFADDLTEDQQDSYVPLVLCRDCGAMGFAGTMRRSDVRLNPDLKSFYSAHFKRPPSPNVAYLFPEDLQHLDRDLDGYRKKLCPGCLRVMPENAKECPGCNSTELIEVFHANSERMKSRRRVGTHECPYCNSPDGLTVLGSRAASLSSVLVVQLFSSSYNDDKKLLAFSDSVQDAAYRAGFFKARTYRFGFRAALQQFVQERGEGMSLAEAKAAFSDFWLSRMDQDRFIAFFLAPNMAWFNDYDYLITKGKLPKGSRLLDDVKRRIGWEITSEYGFMARVGRTLEKTSSSMVQLDSERLGAAVDGLGERLRNEIGCLRELPAETVKRFVLGMVMHLKDQGGIFDRGLDEFVADRGKTYRVNKKVNWMANFGWSARTPVFACSMDTGRFERLLSSKNTWYNAWVFKCLGPHHATLEAELDRVWALVVKALVAGRVLEQRGEKGLEIWGLAPGALRITRQVAHFRCRRCGHSASAGGGDAAAWDGAPCLRFHCTGAYAPETRGIDYYGKLYTRGELERIFSEEHTGLLTRREREQLEQRFKEERAKRRPWYPNLLSCTPTLEMGIDIGDLSSLILCSVPPTTANYLQRIGRAGRRDGNALSVTVANGREHDQYFYAEPREMIAGHISSPGVFLKASAVLERQLTAFCFDHWVQSGISTQAVPRQVSTVLGALSPPDPDRFPHNLLEFIDTQRTGLFRRFLELFGLGEQEDAGLQLKKYLEGDQSEEGSLGYKLLDCLEGLQQERKALNNQISLLAKRIKELKASKAKDQNYDRDLKDLVREKEALQRRSRDLGRKNVFNFLTDEGLLPNYAFPESGVVLKSIIYRKKADWDSDEERKYDFWSYEYARAAVAGLTELAPENDFFAGGRKVTIDQVDMNVSDIETWRLCPWCSYAELQAGKEPTKTCKRCGSTGWADEGQKRHMLRMRQVIATTSDRDSRISDDSEAREPNFYVRDMLVDFEPEAIQQAYHVEDEDLPFGFEFLSRCTLREINFGEKADAGTKLAIAGLEIPRNGFQICKYCGKVQNQFRRENQQIHALTCKARQPAADQNVIDCIYLYRQVTSEAIRIMLPVSDFWGSARTVHSFVAALHLGLRRRFRGNIDHLRIAAQSEPIAGSTLRRQLLVLYDSVPGGTGYLKQLMLTGDELMQVFEAALEDLTTCSCNEDPEKDGCYRCLFAYRHAYDMKETSRQEAVALLSKVVAARDKLKQIASLKQVPVNKLFESELEVRFVEALRRYETRKSPVHLSKKVVNGKTGSFLRFAGRAWYVEPQVKLGPAQGVDITSIPDFVIRPARAAEGIKPVAVFTDGWAHHKDRIGKDTAQRMALIRAGYVVWSLSWNDVMTQFKKLDHHYLRPLDPAKTPRGGLVSKWCADHDIKGLRDAISDNAFDGLMRYLANPDAAQWSKLAFVLGLSLVDAKGYQTEQAWQEWNTQLGYCLPGHWALKLSPRLGDKLLGAQAYSAGTSAKALRLFVTVSKEALQNRAFDDLGFVCHLNDEPQERQQEKEYLPVWNGFLWLINMLQFLPLAAFVTAEGLAADEYTPLEPFTEGEPEEAGDGARQAGWEDVLEQTDPDLYALLDELAAKGWPTPEDPPFELTDSAGAITAEAELAWPADKIAVIRQDLQQNDKAFQEAGWKTVSQQVARADPGALLKLRE